MRLEAKHMICDQDALLCAETASRLSDTDGPELAAMLRADWGAERTAQNIAHIERAERRLSLLAGYCRLAAQLLRS